MMKTIMFVLSMLIASLSLYAQRCPQWPADCPETGYIEDAQGATRADYYGLLPQEVAMQDKMRTIFTNMMKQASEKTGWSMVEISEYTNNNPMQGGIDIPYNSRSPRGILITFQFVVNPQSLSGWKTYETGYEKKHLNDETQDYHNVISATESPLYKRYKDSADYYQKRYLAYIDKHKGEGVALYTKDKHPKYYQQQQSGFIDKMTAMTDGQHEDDRIEQKEYEHDIKARQFRNNTVVQVEFNVNDFVAEPVNLANEPTLIYSISPYPKQGAKVSKIYSFSAMRGGDSAMTKWSNTILLLLGNFLEKPNDAGLYDAGFNHNSQGDEHAPKKIKSDKIQTISVIIRGADKYIRQIAALIDVDKLNSTIVKQ